MSIIVNGMNIPKCCIDCPIWNCEFGACQLIPDSCYYGEDGEIYDPFTVRYEKCPLREIED